MADIIAAIEGLSSSALLTAPTFEDPANAPTAGLKRSPATSRQEPHYNTLPVSLSSGSDVDTHALTPTVDVTSPSQTAHDKPKLVASGSVSNLASGNQYSVAPLTARRGGSFLVQKQRAEPSGIQSANTTLREPLALAVPSNSNAATSYSQGASPSVSPAPLHPGVAMQHLQRSAQQQQQQQQAVHQSPSTFTFAPQTTSVFSAPPTSRAAAMTSLVSSPSVSPVDHADLSTAAVLLEQPPTDVLQRSPSSSFSIASDGNPDAPATSSKLGNWRERVKQANTDPLKALKALADKYSTSHPPAKSKSAGTTAADNSISVSHIGSDLKRGIKKLLHLDDASATNFADPDDAVDTEQKQQPTESTLNTTISTITNVSQHGTADDSDLMSDSTEHSSSNPERALSLPTHTRMRTPPRIRINGIDALIAQQDSADGSRPQTASETHSSAYNDASDSDDDAASAGMTTMNGKRSSHRAQKQLGVHWRSQSSSIIPDDTSIEGSTNLLQLTPDSLATSMNADSLTHVGRRSISPQPLSAREALADVGHSRTDSVDSQNIHSQHNKHRHHHHKRVTSSGSVVTRPHHRPHGSVTDGTVLHHHKRQDSILLFDDDEAYDAFDAENTPPRRDSSGHMSDVYQQLQSFGHRLDVAQAEVSTLTSQLPADLLPAVLQRLNALEEQHSQLSNTLSLRIVRLENDLTQQKLSLRNQFKELNETVQSLSLATRGRKSWSNGWSISDFAWVLFSWFTVGLATLSQLYPMFTSCCNRSRRKDSDDQYADAVDLNHHSPQVLDGNRSFADDVYLQSTTSGRSSNSPYSNDGSSAYQHYISSSYNQSMNSARMHHRGNVPPDASLLTERSLRSRYTTPVVSRPTTGRQHSNGSSTSYSPNINLQHDTSMGSEDTSLLYDASDRKERKHRSKHKSSKESSKSHRSSKPKKRHDV